MQGMGLRSAAPPQLRQIRQTTRLTKAAKLRLSWLDYYHTHSQNAALTVRHFGFRVGGFTHVAYISFPGTGAGAPPPGLTKVYGVA